MIQPTVFVPFGYTQESYALRRNLRRTGTTIGIAVLVVMGISFFWANAFYAIAGSMGITSLQAYNFVSNPAVLQAVQVVLSMLMFTLPFIITVKVRGESVSALVPLKKPERKFILPLFLTGIGFCAFANIAVSVCGDVFRDFGIDYSVDFGENPQGFFGLLLSLLSTVAVPAMVEEFAFRGITLGLLRRFGDAFAIIASAAVFGLMHGNFEQMPFAFLVGLVLGYITVKSGTIWISVAVHAFNNGISVIFDYAFGGVPSNIVNIGYTVLLVIMLLVAVIALIPLKKACGDKDMFEFENTAEICEPSKKFKWFFTSPVIIVFAVLCVLESCLYFFI